MTWTAKIVQEIKTILFSFSKLLVKRLEKKEEKKRERDKVRETEERKRNSRFIDKFMHWLFSHIYMYVR